MLRISKLTDYAVVLLGSLAEIPSALVSASGLSERTGLPEPTVAKILKLLAGGGIVVSVRGAQGGYRMERQAQQITLAEVITAIDGPVSLTACVEGSTESCSFAHNCSVNGRWNKVNSAVRGALDGITLADMIVPVKGCGGHKDLKERLKG